jgi:hypothetical protein
MITTTFIRKVTSVGVVRLYLLFGAGGRTKRKETKMSGSKRITTRRSLWKNGGPEQAVSENALHETNAPPSVTEPSSLACLLEESDRRIYVWFQTQHGIFADDTKTIASLGLNTIILLCIYTRLRPDVPYNSMARHVSNVISSAGDEADTLVRYHTYNLIVQEAQQIRSQTIDECDAIHIATTGLIARLAGVLGVF